MFDFNPFFSSLDQTSQQLRSQAPSASRDALLAQLQKQMEAAALVRQQAEAPDWQASLDAMLADERNAGMRQNRTGYDQTMGKILSGGASRGTLGGSGDARMRGQAAAGLQAANEGLNLGIEQTRTQAQDGRQEEIAALLDAIAQSGSGLTQGVRGQIDALRSAGQADQWRGQLRQASRDALSQGLGGIFTSAGDFAAAGFANADRRNLRLAGDRTYTGPDSPFSFFDWKG